MGEYEDLIRDSVDLVLRPDRPLTLGEISDAMGTLGHPVLDVTVLEIILRASPGRFVEVAPGTWVRRDDGPEAGVPSKPLPPPLAGSAAAAAIRPELDGSS
jgi:hypothetical protein